MPQGVDHCSLCRQNRDVAVCKIAFRFNLDRAPPGVPPECVLCPSCDPLWRETGQPSLQLPETGRRGNHAGTCAGTGGGNHSTVAAAVGVVVATPAGAVASMSDYQAALAGKRRVVAHTATSAMAANRAGSKRGLPAAVGYEAREAHAPFGSAGTTGGGFIHPDCTCAVPSKLLTVNKEGPNKGRKFFSCSKPR